MLCVIEGGSTKADWLIEENGVIIDRLSTIGFNPFFHTSEFIYKTLADDSALSKYAERITNLHYFGAGCSADERKAIVKKGFADYFVNAEIIVEHDLLACAYATCGDDPGIACILGTGSNSCYFDGVNVHERNYGLGYILGDEGSGSYYGKKLVTSFLYKRMPADISKHFESAYHLDKNTIIRKVYNEPDANVWLASFSRFLDEYRTDPFIHTMILNGMEEFIDLYICDYENYSEIPVHFVGSLAFIFSDELKTCLAKHNITPGKIIKQPIDELMNYFLKKRIHS
jgi:N-acetylglucosamine kinase-like BadF-type ATPase